MPFWPPVDTASAASSPHSGKLLRLLNNKFPANPAFQVRRGGYRLAAKGEEHCRNVWTEHTSSPWHPRRATSAAHRWCGPRCRGISTRTTPGASDRASWSARPAIECWSSRSRSCSRRSQPRDGLDVLRELVDDRLRQRRARLAERGLVVGGGGPPAVRRLSAVAPVDRRLERALRALPRRELDVRGREEVAGLDQALEVDVLEHGPRDVAAPDRGAGAAVRSADRDHVVEPAVAQEGGVERPDEVRGADEQPVAALPEPGDDLQELVRHALQRRGRLAAAHAGDLLDLVDEHDRVLELVDLGERLAQGERQAVPRPGQARREDLDERPAEPRRDRLGERRLAGSGRTEEDDRARRDDAVLLRGVGVLERKDDPPLDDLLLVLHPGERRPEVARQHAPAELLEAPDLLRLQRHDALEVREAALLVAAVVERLQPRLSLGEQRRQAMDAPGQKPLLELGEHHAAEPAPAPVVGEREQHHPAAIAADPRRRRADDDLADRHDDRAALVAERAEDLGEAVDRPALPAARLLPDADDLVEVVLVEVADPRGRHRASLPRARSRVSRPAAPRGAPSAGPRGRRRRPTGCASATAAPRPASRGRCPTGGAPRRASRPGSRRRRDG